MVDPYINPDAKWRKGARDYRRKRGLPVHLIAVAVALVVLGGGFVYYLLNRPTSADRLRELVPAFLADWDSLETDALRKKWFIDDYKSRAKFFKLMGRKGWTTARPALRLTAVETHPTGKAGRTEFHPEGLPPEAQVKIYWQWKHGRWEGTSVTLKSVPDLE